MIKANLLFESYSFITFNFQCINDYFEVVSISKSLLE